MDENTLINDEQENKKAIFVCSYCKKEFEINQTMEIHMEQEHNQSTNAEDNETSHVCTQCLKDFKSGNCLKMHIEQDHNFVNLLELPNFKSKMLNTYEYDLEKLLESLPKDILSNEGTKVFECDKCKFHATTNVDLLVHQQMVHDPNFYICNKCETRTKTVDALDFHMRNKHGVQPANMNKCQECQEEFNIIGDLLTHRAKHQEAENSKDDHDSDDLGVLKTYKLNHFKNSDGESFGMTIKGKSKDYIMSHGKIKDLLTKGREYSLSYKDKNKNRETKIKVLDVANGKAMTNATVEILIEQGSRGRAELKVYNPSIKSKKGATIEIRKMSDYDYMFAKELSKVLTVGLIDKLVSGENIEDILSNRKKKNPENKARIFSCHICNWMTKYQGALKNHYLRIHKKLENNTVTKTVLMCNTCDYQPKSNDDLKIHVKILHEVSAFTCSECAISFDVESDVKKHREEVHPRAGVTIPELAQEQSHMDHDDYENNLRNKRPRSFTPPSSPPKKKQEQDGDEEEVRVSNKKVNDMMIKIKEIEIENAKHIAEKEEMRIQIDKLLLNHEGKENVVNDEVREIRPIPNHLTSVHQRHLNQLKGYRMRMCAIPNGACLTNCLCAHMSCTDNKTDREKFNRLVNHHIADHWDRFYQFKISLPYSEQIGVGTKARQVTCKTKEEMLAFLRSEESLTVFSNYQELLAIANMLNITVKVFSYDIDGDITKSDWSEVSPDSTMTKFSHFPHGVIPDMALYNNNNSHYDLLVLDDSKLAILGLIGSDVNETDYPKHVDNEMEWQEIKGNKSETKLDNNYDDKDINELDEEKIILSNKQSGHERMGPQFEPVPKFIGHMFKCHWKNCGTQLESKGLLIAHIEYHITTKHLICDQCQQKFSTQDDLDAHMKSEHMRTNQSTNDNLNRHINSEHMHINKGNCDQCKETFNTNSELKAHMNKDHKKKDPNASHNEWNCNDCNFQTNTSASLRNHLQLSGHQPSKKIQDTVGQLITCHTCSDKFTNKWALMNHRRDNHPSNRVCRYFLKNECIHGDVNCWYKHTTKEQESSRELKLTHVNQHKCYVCANEFQSKSTLMSHMKTEHSTDIVCKKFIEGLCDRGSETCWYQHRSLTINSSSHPKSTTKSNVLTNSDKSSAQNINQSDYPRLPRDSTSSANQSDFQYTQINTVPPEQPTKLMLSIDLLCQRMDALEKILVHQKTKPI